jgi:hypothetical protein
VAELRLYGLDRGALDDQQRRAGVAKVVHPQRPGQQGRPLARLGCSEDALVRLGDRLLVAGVGPLGEPQRPAARCGEHQRLGVVRPAGQVRRELGGQKPRQPHGARLMGLDAAPLEPAVNLGRRLADADRAGEHVDPTDPERGQLARPEPRVGGKAYERVVRGPDRLGELLDLGGGEKGHLPALRLRLAHLGGDVAGEAVPLDCRGEDLGQDLQRLAGPLRAEASLGRAGEPLAHHQRVDRGEGEIPEARQDLQVEGLAIVTARTRPQRCGARVPALGPLTERHLAGGRVDVGAAELGILHRDDMALGVDLPREGLRALFAGRVAPARPPGLTVPRLRFPAGAGAPGDLAPRRLALVPRVGVLAASARLAVRAMQRLLPADPHPRLPRAHGELLNAS